MCGPKPLLLPAAAAAGVGPAVLQVVQWLLVMLQKSRGEAAPHSTEAQRALTFFATSLSNPNMPSAQPVALTRSMTTLTPHCKSGHQLACLCQHAC
jgi:hypothetical protein